ncbi:hypothetical protein D3C86_2026600 [compost metagenome]
MVERTARVIVLALLLELYPGIDQIDDVGASQQVIDKYTRNSSSHKPLLRLPINENKPRIPFGKHGLRMQLLGLRDF